MTFESTAFFTGVGRRKSAVAQLRVTAGNGEYIVNGKITPLPDQLKRLLQDIGKFGQLSISAVVRGGGISSQVEAICLGVARALVQLNPDLKSGLRKIGFLTVDARVKERKKPGLKRARRAPQWAKR